MKPMILNVVDSYSLGLAMHRLVLAGPDLIEGRIPDHHAGKHIKLLYKKPEQASLTLPDVQNGKIIWPAPDNKPTARTYSISKFNSKTQELTVDFVKHAAPGIACDFARYAQPGDEIGFSGPGPARLTNDDAANYLFVGDLSAVPAISAIMDTLPPNANVKTFIEVEDFSLIEELCTFYFSSMNNCVKFVKQRFEPNSTLLPLVQALDIADESTQWSITIAGEHQTVVSIRDHFKTLNIPKSHIYAVPYWRKNLDEETYHAQRHQTMDS